MAEICCQGSLDFILQSFRPATICASPSATISDGARRRTREFGKGKSSEGGVIGN
jgi:hypothetical protein